jgi:hypothetical protein
MVYTGNGSVECAVKKLPGANFKFIFSVNFWSILEAVTLDKRPPYCITNEQCIPHTNLY